MVKNYTLILTLLLAGLTRTLFAQETGDFRSAASGDWNSNSTWEVFDGATWNAATSFPSATNESDASTVYLEAGFTVTLTQAEGCGDLHLNGTQDVQRLNVGPNILDVWGKLRTYSGAAPGTSEGGGSGSGIAGWINTDSTAGAIRLRGTVDRVVVESGEFTGNSRTAGWNLEFAFDPGVTGTVNKTMRCGYLVVSSGILTTGIEQIRISGDDFTAQPGNGESKGTCIVKSGAHYMTASIHKNNATSAGNSLASFVLEEGAFLTPTVTGMFIAAVSYDLSGTVYLGQSSFIGSGLKANSQLIVNYGNVVVQSSATGLLNDVVIEDTLFAEKDAPIFLNSFNFSYGAGATVVYKGDVAQTVANEFPETDGPDNVVIDNALGVEMAVTRTTTNLIQTSGNLTISNGELIIGAAGTITNDAPSASNMIVLSPTGKLTKSFSGTGSFTYPVGDNTSTLDYSPITVTVNSGDNLGSTPNVSVQLVDAEHPADQSVALANLSRYWFIESGITGGSYDVSASYLAIDTIGDGSTLKNTVYETDQALSSSTVYGEVSGGSNVLTFTGITELGYFTGSNRCILSGNTIELLGDSEFCGSTGETVIIQGSTPTVAGTVNVQWQSSTDGVSYSNVSPGDSLTLLVNPGLSPGSYSYRRLVSDMDFCGSSENDTSTVVTLEVLAEVGENTIGATTTEFCEMITGFELTGTTPTGGNGSYTYSWQSSSVGTSLSEFSTLETAAEFNTSEVDTFTVVRIVSSGVCVDTSLTLELVTITPLTGGTIGPDQVVPEGVDPDPIEEVLVLGGGTGDYQYQWYESTELDGPYSSIGTALASSYDPGVLTDSTYFIREVVSGPCSLTDTAYVYVDIVDGNAFVAEKLLSVYPNPVQDRLWIDAEAIEVLRVQVFSASGVKVFDALPSFGGYDLSFLASGHYILRITHGAGTSESLMHKL